MILVLPNRTNQTISLDLPVYVAFGKTPKRERSNFRKILKQDRPTSYLLRSISNIWHPFSWAGSTTSVVSHLLYTNINYKTEREITFVFVFLRTNFIELHQEKYQF